MDLRDLLALVPREDDRQELLRLRQEYHAAGAGSRERAAARREELVDTALQRIRWHLRNARYPLPSREEVAAMLEADSAGSGTGELR